MTELVVAPTQPGGTTNLVAWAQAASAANDLGRALCQTSFVPAVFKDKPGEATAAILFGAEAGLSPLASLQGVYVISGKPAMYARTLLAVALAAGHEIWTEEITDTKAIVCGRRRGSSNVERSVWTLDRAKKAGYTKNAKYQSDPQAMLLARAQSDVCRRVAPDALLGMAYSVEELEDEQTPSESVKMSRTEPARKTARRALPAAPEPVEPPLDEPTQDGIFITAPQMKKLHAAMNDAGLSDRALGLMFISETIGRTVETSKDLTKDEASRVIDRLEQHAEAATDQGDDGPPEQTKPPFDDPWASA